VVGTNPQGATNIDITESSDGKFLYSLNAAAGSISGFAIDAATGALTNLGTFGRLPPAAGENGIAAN
jgi:6-phosphogluconolactonase (cycloisomerase 2 family)